MLRGFVPEGFCPVGVLSQRGFVLEGFCPRGVLSLGGFVLGGFILGGLSLRGFAIYPFARLMISIYNVVIKLFKSSANYSS